MPVVAAQHTPTNNVMPDGIASPPSEWTALLTLFGHLNPWLVGGAARALYFNLHHASKPRDWDIIVPVERAAAITQTMSRLSTPCAYLLI